MKKDIKTVDEYFAEFPATIQYRLEEIRKLIKKMAPEADESIAYGMPAYKLHKKPLIYFGAFEKHIGFYATPNTHEKFKQELSVYKQGKGSVQFPYDKPLPAKLIAKMVAYKADELNAILTDKKQN